MFLVMSHGQVNGKATMMFTDLINDEVHDNVIWSEVPYLTDEHGSKLRYKVCHSCLFLAV